MEKYVSVSSPDAHEQVMRENEYLPTTKATTIRATYRRALAWFLLWGPAISLVISLALLRNLCAISKYKTPMTTRGIMQQIRAFPTTVYLERWKQYEFSFNESFQLRRELVLIKSSVLDTSISCCSDKLCLSALSFTYQTKYPTVHIYVSLSTIRKTSFPNQLENSIKTNVFTN